MSELELPRPADGVPVSPGTVRDAFRLIESVVNGGLTHANLSGVDTAIEPAKLALRLVPVGLPFAAHKTTWGGDLAGDEARLRTLFTFHLPRNCTLDRCMFTVEAPSGSPACTLDVHRVPLDTEVGSASVLNGGAYALAAGDFGKQRWFGGKSDDRRLRNWSDAAISTAYRVQVVPSSLADIECIAGVLWVLMPLTEEGV